MRLPALLLLAALGAAAAETSNNSTGEILKASETADPKKVDIVKQIRRVNDDGSYTVGYEAGDGTFKIESRDVLGNVKGTFGYIDQDGEVKRVTYSSSNTSTPLPVQVSTTPPTQPPARPTAAVSTTRRPLATVVYPRSTTRGTVIQPIPRKRPLTTGDDADVSSDTKESTSETTTSNILNLYKSKQDETTTKLTKMMAKNSESTKEVLQTRQTSTEASPRIAHTVKPVYEEVTEKELAPTRPNQFRRQLPTAATDNPHMLLLQQSAGDDSTDVYGGHRPLGTVRPLFTTTTNRPRLVPFSSILAARQKLQEHLPRARETVLEASTDRVFDRQRVPAVSDAPTHRLPQHRDRADEVAYHQPLYTRQYPNLHFHTTEYLRENPGAPIPIGNQRAFVDYGLRPQQQQPQVQQHVHSPQYYAPPPPPPPPPPQEAKPVEAVAPVPYALRPVARIIPVAVDERGVPIPGYRFAVNPFEPAAATPQPDPVPEDMRSIATPVSTRDLRRLLHALLLRQSRLQTLMDEISAPGPPYRSLQFAYRPEPQYDPQPAPLYQTFLPRPPPQEPHRAYDDYHARQQEAYEPPHYESERRSAYLRPQYRHYDTEAANSNRLDGGVGSGDYLPADVREALLLKMLMLAISPDYTPSPRPIAFAPALLRTPAPPTELTTAAPVYRKRVRNVQILGEEGSEDDMKRRAQVAAAQQH